MSKCEHMFEPTASGADQSALGVMADGVTVFCRLCDEEFVPSSKLEEAGKQFDAALSENRSLLSRLDKMWNVLDRAVAVILSEESADEAAVVNDAIDLLHGSDVERHEHKYGDDGRCSCGIHALD